MSILFKSRQSGAQQSQISKQQKLVMWFTSHVRQAITSFGELLRTPAASFMTIAVLGLSITLPSTLYILVKNLDNISANTQDAAEISLFIREGATRADVDQLIKRLRTWPEIDALQYISPEDALQEFKQQSGFGSAIDALQSNPLPAVLLIYPTEKHGSPAAAKFLLNKLTQEREIELGKVDIEWLERLHAIMAVTNELVTMIAVLLFVSVILIVGNTIRLNIFNKRNEIMVMKLVGATDGFIQRPFLYTGLWYGVLGGIMSWITVALLLWWMSYSIGDILTLYRQEFVLAGLDFATLNTMLLMSVLMGLIGSAISVKRYVDQIEPE
ncbi:MAG: cell division protein FtsX [Alteromonadaceae bacterium]|nr:cell division protein FtsX [Alteromonadaceae bacterium]